MSINRLKEDLIELGRLGRKNQVETRNYEDLDMDKGLWRLEGNEQSKVSKDFIISKMKEAGLEVRFDRVGNIFGRKVGTDPNKRAVMSGSHLDSVKNGGQFDGPLGVISVLEAIRIMNEEGFQNERPIELSIFVGEEGSAFYQGLIGSEVLVGDKTYDEVEKIKNDEGKPLKEVLKDYRSDYEFDINSVEYFIELHPEQGPVLYNENTPIGIVEEITGITWVKAVIYGQENHSGTTPMNSRKDPLVAASDVVSFTDERVKELLSKKGGQTVATVGKFEVYPSATNIIPGEVELGIDIRDKVDENIKLIRNDIIKTIDGLESKYQVKTQVETLFHKPPSPCSKEVVEAIYKASETLNIQTRRMSSGAAHDAQNIAKKVKTAMIFVPSVDGISHSPFEWSRWEDLEKGVNVLTQTLKNLSQY
ncbi:M20 family metallo-hydrolase [Natranaerobius trueperi]|uniref:Peptidase M20 dimerisation domain-containing protein n=1 Tax=Natranaerobius trueperi TaxID=759412 RepID=A0A226C0A6_9FIRM|nr:M20 family metallo-hydrolase [Natranaerobius trueperi]OWZ84656.1 hypothetical protein CDO51_02530 [Natranaerobius trueperi]